MNTNRKARKQRGFIRVRFVFIRGYFGFCQMLLKRQW